LPDLPQRKVGIIACSGEELTEGTVSRQAALKVLGELRSGKTVTICLPLFLAGGEGDRAFARTHPTIALDGCEKRCAFRGTEMYSHRPAAGFVVTELVARCDLKQPHGRRKLDGAGMVAVDVLARQVAEKVDELLGGDWSSRVGVLEEPGATAEGATCACGSRK
jgi:uncharacterized metal-binding protein